MPWYNRPPALGLGHRVMFLSENSLAFYRPGYYWYFLDGNQIREAMAAGLMAMCETGLYKFFLEVNIGVPRGPVDFISEEWQDNIVDTGRLADELGKEFILGIGPGWVGAGGPWLKSELSFQHLRNNWVKVKGPWFFYQHPGTRTSRTHAFCESFIHLGAQIILGVYDTSDPKTLPVYVPILQ